MPEGVAGISKGIETPAPVLLGGLEVGGEFGPAGGADTGGREAETVPGPGELTGPQEEGSVERERRWDRISE